jgi:hypothetical protein
MLSNSENEEYSSDECEEIEQNELVLPSNITELPEEIEKLEKKSKPKTKKEAIVRKKKKAPKPIIVYMSSDDEPEIIVKPKVKKGRPKAKKNIVYHDKDGNVVKTRNEAKETVISLPEPEKKFSASELKMIALEEKVLELEQISGKKVLTTKKKTIDKRSTKAPSEKQIIARKKFVENNKLRAQARREKKLADAKETGKANAVGVIEELKTEKKKSTKMKNELLAEIAKMKEKEQVEVKKVVKDTFFD